MVWFEGGIQVLCSGLTKAKNDDDGGDGVVVELVMRIMMMIRVI